MAWHKWLAAGISAALALVVGWSVRRSFVRSAGPRRDVGAESTSFPRPVDEAFVRDHWHDLPEFEYHPLALLVRAPNVKSRWKWEEHPRRAFYVETNAQGFREDEPTPRRFDGPRVVVSGDSHTDGAVQNRASFANVAERRLGRALRRPVDVVNAGVGFTSPYCYLGMLRKCLELEPDVFVAVLFAGNDFLDDLALAYRRGARSGPCQASPRLPFEAALEECGGVFQGLHQASRFKGCPAEGELALEVVLESVFAMEELCRSEGIAFLLVLLPTKTDVEDDDREACRAACELLELEEADLAVNLRLGRRALEAARARGIECLDPTEALRAADVPTYWKRDHHLGLAGHEQLGALLVERLRALLERRATDGQR